MKRKIELPHANAEYVGYEIKDDTLVVKLYSRGIIGMNAVREMEIDVPDNAPDKIRYEYRRDSEGIINFVDTLPVRLQTEAEEKARMYGKKVIVIDDFFKGE